jgi:L-ascorbate metabolism protein UlaG (beta-lactamase superfamily)
MHIAKYLHSCLLVQDGDAKILIDPGMFSFAEGGVKPGDLRDITTVLITHNHGDHADPAALKTIIANNPGLKIYGNADTKNSLAKESIPVELFETGEKKISTMAIEAFPAEHQKLIRPISQNTAYLLNKLLLVTGDSLDARLMAHRGVKVLASPIMGPWAGQVEIAEFITKIAPVVFIPLHEAYVKESFAKRMTKMFAEHLAGFNIELRPLKTGEWLEAAP